MFPRIDVNKNGLAMFFEPYEQILVEHAFNNRVEFNSREAYKIANEALNARGLHDISRASVINFLNGMVDAGFLTYREETCKGGSRRIYTAHTGTCQLYKTRRHEMDLKTFVTTMGQTIFERLHDLAPDAPLEEANS